MTAFRLQSAGFSVLALFVVVILGGCALGAGDSRYRLMAPEIETPASESSEVAGRVLAIARPQTDRTRDSSRIIVRRGRSLMPWANAAWIDTAPDIVQSLLIDYLDGRLGTVGRHGSLPAAHRLDLELAHFELVEANGGLTAHVALTARLFDPEGGLMAAKGVEAREQAATAESLDASVAAMEAAMQSAFASLGDWLDEHLTESRDRN